VVLSYVVNNPGIVANLLWEHLQMVGFSSLITVVLAVPLALLVNYYPRFSIPIMGLLGIVYTIPSLALIIFFVPILGLNSRPVILAMVLYGQVILVRNLVAGLRGISPDIYEASQGMGMNGWQRWWWVEVPLILPLFLAGLRLGAVVAIAVATIGAKFGAGGLGTLLFDGIAQTDRYDKIWAGVISVVLLALVINTGLLLLEKLATKQPT
jgi:osmoprotectant transport system permease protein